MWLPIEQPVVIEPTTQDDIRNNLSPKFKEKLSNRTTSNETIIFQKEPEQEWTYYLGKSVKQSSVWNGGASQPFKNGAALSARYSFHKTNPNLERIIFKLHKDDDVGIVLITTRFHGLKGEKRKLSDEETETAQPDGLSQDNTTATIISDAYGLPSPLAGMSLDISTPPSDIGSVHSENTDSDAIELLVEELKEKVQVYQQHLNYAPFSAVHSHTNIVLFREIPANFQLTEHDCDCQDDYQRQIFKFKVQKNLNNTVDILFKFLEPGTITIKLFEGAFQTSFQVMDPSCSKENLFKSEAVLVREYYPSETFATFVENHFAITLRRLLNWSPQIPRLSDPEVQFLLNEWITESLNEQPEDTQSKFWAWFRFCEELIADIPEYFAAEAEGHRLIHGFENYLPLQNWLLAASPGSFVVRFPSNSPRFKPNRLVVMYKDKKPKVGTAVIKVLRGLNNEIKFEDEENSTKNNSSFVGFLKDRTTLTNLVLEQGRDISKQEIESYFNLTSNDNDSYGGFKS